MYLVKTPNIVQQAYRSYSWRVNTNENRIFLSFDDGPNPVTTELILSILSEYNAKASFFCLGGQVDKYPDLYNAILKDGHSIGNHGYRHISGWKSNTEEYCENADKAYITTQSKMFRPPYGRIKPAQAKILSKKYHIVMWDVMSGDFDLSLNAEECFDNVKRKAKPGSIVVLHDNAKAASKIELLLPMILDYFSECNFSFDALSPDILSF